MQAAGVFEVGLHRFAGSIRSVLAGLFCTKLALLFILINRWPHQHAFLVCLPG